MASIPESALRMNTDTAPELWTNDPTTIAQATIREVPGIVDTYSLSEITIHLKRIHENLYLISNHCDRFFLWNSDSSILSYILTPHSLLGFYRAFDANQILETDIVLPWVEQEVTEADLIHCPDEHKPDNWIRNAAWVLPYEVYSLREFDLHDRKPIMVYKARRGNEDMTFLQCDQKYYLYWHISDELWEIVKPNMTNQANWKRLESAPTFPDFTFRKLGFAAMVGGRRILKQSEIPDEYVQLDDNECAKLEIEPDVVPPTHQYQPVSSIIAREDGAAHLVEIGGGGGFCLWYPFEDTMEKVYTSGGLAEILAIMRNDQHLNIVQF